MNQNRRTFFSSLTAAFAGCFGLISAAKASTSKSLADYAELASGPVYRHTVAERVRTDISRWEMNTENTVPEFCHSGSNGFNVTVKGKCRGDVAGEQILNTADEIYYRAQVGDLVTLKLYENAS